MRVRAAQTGDICLLLVPSRPPSPKVKALLEGLKGEFGGRIIEPLHVTVDRVAAADTEGLVRAVRECAPRLRSATVRGSGVFVLRSAYRGADVLKLHVDRDEALDHDVDELRAALRQAGLNPMYGDDRAMTVTALEGIERPAAPNVTALGPQPHQGPLPLGLPIDLFVGDTLLVSRIRGVGNYEILDTAMLQPSG